MSSMGQAKPRPLAATQVATAAGASATSIRFLAQALASAAALTSPEAVGGFIDLATGLGTGSAGHSGSAGGAAHPEGV